MNKTFDTHLFLNLLTALLGKVQLLEKHPLLSTDASLQRTTKQIQVLGETLAAFIKETKASSAKDPQG